MIDAETIERLFMDTPHNQALGFKIVETSLGKGLASMPYGDHLVGNPETGVIHGGVITCLMDVVCALGVFTTLEEFVPMATLDLRIDYLRPATPGKALLGYGHCYKRTRNVAFTRGIAYQDDRDDPIANAVATYIIHPGTPR